jgi:hypothetical protein
MADRLRFLIANPAVREAAGRTARDRIEAQYQWQKVAEDIEKTYFTIMGAEVASAPIKKPSVLAAAGAREGSERRAG